MGQKGKLTDATSIWSGFEMLQNRYVIRPTQSLSDSWQVIEISEDGSETIVAAADTELAARSSAYLRECVAEMRRKRKEWVQHVVGLRSA